MNIPLFVLFILVFSILVALAEIQIEGEFGWAKKLPTWRKQINLGPINFELTGYHLYFFSFIFLLFHFRFVFQPFTIKDELITIAAFILSVGLEDFFWFMLNPKYGLRKYNKKYVYWFRSWFLGFPSFYFFIFPLGILLLILGLSL
jgi:hypothetical protein